MLALSVPAPAAPYLSLPYAWPRAGHQWLPVSGFIPYRYLVSYRAPAQALAPLVPRGFELDTRRGFGFVSVCALEVKRMGVSGTPSFLRFANREFLYRLALRLAGEPTFATLRSDVSSRALAVLGRRFSHYRPRLAQVSARSAGAFRRLECVSADGAADAVLEVELSAESAPKDSIFSSADEASQFLLGMKFSADAQPEGRIQVQPIEHGAWNASWAQVRCARFDFLTRLAARIGAPLVYDHTLAMQNIEQRWGAAKWL